MSKAWIWLLVCLLLLVFGFIAWRILCHNDVEIVDQDENVSLSLWEEVYLQWEIRMDGKTDDVLEEYIKVCGW